MKKFLSLVLALSMVFALVACGGGANNTPSSNNGQNNQQNTDTPSTPDTNTPDTTVEEKRPNRLVYGSTTEISGDLGNAWWTNNAVDKTLRDLINDYGTVSFDQFGAMVINETTCAGIESVANADGTKTFTVKIKEGLKYNNGEPITAADYVAYALVCYAPATLEAQASISTATIFGSDAYQKGETKYLAGVRLIDEYTYALTVNADYAGYYYELSYASLSPLYLPMYAGGRTDLVVKDDGEGAYIDGGELVASEIDASRYIYADRVSAGPYMLKELDTGARTATLVINPNYAGNFEGVKPSIETLVVVKSNEDTQFDTFTTGEVNILDSLSTGADVNKAMDLVEQGGYNYCQFERNGYGKIMFQCDGGPTRFQAVRQAIAYMLDRNEFANTFCEGYGSVVHGPYGLAMWMYKESEELFAEKMNTYSYNPDKAIELLVADGWTLNADGTEYSGTGLRYKEVTAEQAGDYAKNVTLADGRILMPLHIMWSSSEGNTVSDLLATMLAEGPQVAAAGMVIEQNIMTFAELLNWMYRDGSVDPKYTNFTYGMYNLATNFTPVYDMSFNWSLDPVYVEMGYNQNYLFDTRMDQLSMDMVYKAAAGDDATYLDYWQQYILLWNELLPEIPLYSNVYFTVFPEWLEGYVQSSLWDFEGAVVYASIKNAE